MYIRYYDTPFELRDPALASERRALLEQEGNIFREPFIEAVPRFKSSGKTVAEACADLKLDARVATFLTTGLFNANQHLYQHQWEAFQAAMSGRNVVVTSGTGSGKTECFLLPVLASLAQESLGWRKPVTVSSVPWWQNDRSGWEPQRTGNGRDAAVRALVLYPMNALVEDQLQRLRKAVDNPDARRWYNDHDAFYFGRYTGRTFTAGQRNNAAKRTQLREYLRDAAETAQIVQDEIAVGTRLDPDERYAFPQFGGGEMHSRWDMQTAPPDILITNYSMLNVMLLRKIEDSIFTQTRQWLEADHNHVFTLVVDELHMYRGTSGSEVAMLLRNLLLRLGLADRPEQVRFIAASASLTDVPEGLSYLEQFFGAPASSFKIISGERNRAALPAHTLPRKPFIEFFHSWKDGDEAARLDAARQLALSLPIPTGHAEIATGYLLNEALSNNGVDGAVLSAMVDTDTHESRPRAYSKVAAHIFGETPAPKEADFALDGLLTALSAAENVGGNRLLPLRAHLFYRSIQGFWACSNPDCTEVAPEYRNEDRSIGKIYASPQWRCACGGRVLELLYCQNCGEAYLGGYKSERSSPTEWVLYPEYPELEQLPDHAMTQRHYGNYAWYWPTRESIPETERTWGSNPYQFHGNRI